MTSSASLERKGEDTMSDFILGDCMEYMRQMPDKAYDLAIVDPPYGDAATHTHTHSKRMF